MATITVGVLALQGGFLEHLLALEAAIGALSTTRFQDIGFRLIEVRSAQELSKCDGLIIPGGQSTSISLIAGRTNLLEALRNFVKIKRRPTWGTCAGLILLAESVSSAREQRLELIGGLDVHVYRNYFGRDSRTFEATMPLPLLGEKEEFRALFLDAPIIGPITSSGKGKQPPIEILARLPTRFSAPQDQGSICDQEATDGIIVAVKQSNVLGTSFHPELSRDVRMHVQWLNDVVTTALGKPLQGLNTK